MLASTSVNTLIEYTRRRHFEAGKGGSGSGNNRRGADGKDVVLPVPMGTQVRDEEGGFIADLSIPGSKVVVARGGVGGRGNASFATPARRAPDFAEKGERGEERWVRLELKLLADVGTVGFPNVGKSTLISRISAARPSIDSYPFTTLEPMLGVVRVDEERSFVISDLPGLIEGAHEGKGLGLRFLRHVERTKVLLYMADVSPGAEPGPERALEIIQSEVAYYDRCLDERPRLLAANKIDVADPQLLEEAGRAAESRGWDFFPISAVTGKGISALVYRLAEMVEITRDGEGPGMPEERTVYTYDPSRERGFEIVEEEGVFHVRGEKVERLVKSVDLESPQALAYIQGRMKRMGVEEELMRKGAEKGDTVVIGDRVFDFLPEE